MTYKLSCYGTGSYITSFISGGPKFYAYKVKKPDGTESCTCKVKGIRLNYSNTEKINFDSIRNLVIGEISPILLTFDSIRRTNFHDVITWEENKIFKEPVYSKRRCRAWNWLLPALRCAVGVPCSRGAVERRVESADWHGSHSRMYVLPE